MKKKIKIFLGSSIVEFKNERQEIENFIYRLSDDFEDRYDISVKPLLCENFDEAYSKIRKQEEYNEKVRTSDLCFFIFFTKAGEYTREEFKVARKKFEESGKPKIYTYFKVLGDEKAEESLYNFMDELDKIFGHYYGTFEHIDTIKLRILLNLKLQEMDFLEIKVDGEECTVDGKKAISLENISEFANNSVFKELKAELEEVEIKYFELKAKYLDETCTEDEEREYIEVASKRQNLIDTIEELRKNIFNISLRMCQDEVRGEITLRQKEAYKLFEQGDLDGANRILDFEEIKNEYKRRKAIRDAEQKKDAQNFIREGKTKIDILEVMYKRTTRFEEIEEIYNEITEVAFEENVEMHVVLNFVWFLYEQKNHKRAYYVAKRLEGFMTGDVDVVRKLSLFFALGVICSEFASKKEETEMYYLKLIAIRKKLAKINPERYNADLARSYNNVGNLYNDQGQVEKAENYYLKSIAIREKLAKKDERYNADLANSYNNAGWFYSDQGQVEKAESYYLKTISIREKLTKINPERYKADLSLSYNNAGDFYSHQGQPLKAEEYYLKAIEIRGELAKSNPDRFSTDLASSYNSVGVFYHMRGQLPKAENYYLKSIGINEKLAERNPEIFNCDLALCYNNIGGFYKDQGQQRKAEEYFNNAITIYEKLVEINPERYNRYLAMCYNNVGILFVNQGQQEKSERYFLKSIVIYEYLAEINPERYNRYLAVCCKNLGAFYDEQQKKEKAKDYYLKSIAIYEKLAETNPERYNADLTVSCYNYANLSKDDNYYEKAIEIAKTCPEHPKCKEIISRLTK